jgi:hypothetical protein
VAPDRRFGLPHPLDADPSEDSSPRKPGLWESFKRALGNSPPEASSPGDRLGPPRPEPTPPIAPRSHSPSRLPATSIPDPPPSTAGQPGLPEIDSDVPFLVEDPAAEPIPSVRSGPDDVRDRTILMENAGAPEAIPVLPEDSSEPPIGAPRLARGLASFSRRNAEREKKFAHLLRDEPGSESKGPGPPRRRR